MLDLELEVCVRQNLLVQEDQDSQEIPDPIFKLGRCREWIGWIGVSDAAWWHNDAFPLTQHVLFPFVSMKTSCRSANVE